MPQSLHSRAAILTTLEAADRFHLPIDRLVLEVTEGAVIDDQHNLQRSSTNTGALGSRVAIDDFGAGYSGLNLLTDFTRPDQTRHELIRGIEHHGPRQAIVHAIDQVCRDLGLT